MSDHEYMKVHNRIYEWVEEGKIPFKGKRSTQKLTELDEFIFNLFDFYQPQKAFNNTMEMHCALIPLKHDFEYAVQSGELDTAWLLGPHGLALLKAKLIQCEAKRMSEVAEPSGPQTKATEAAAIATPQLGADPR